MNFITITIIVNFVFIIIITISFIIVIEIIEFVIAMLEYRGAYVLSESWVLQKKIKHLKRSKN